MDVSNLRGTLLQDGRVIGRVSGVTFSVGDKPIDPGPPIDELSRSIGVSMQMRPMSRGPRRRLRRFMRLMAADA